MEWYYAPGYGPTPIFEQWAAGTLEHVGLLGILAPALVVVVLLSLRWRAAPSGDPSEQAERDLDFERRKRHGGQQAQNP